MRNRNSELSLHFKQATDPKILGLLKQLPRFEDDEDIVYGTLDQIDLAQVVPLVEEQYIKAVFIIDNAESQSLREGMKSDFTLDQWASLQEHTTHHDGFSQRFIGRNNYIQKGKPIAIAEVIPEACLGVMAYHHNLMSQVRSDLFASNSLVFGWVPNATRRGAFPSFHLDPDYDYTVHTTLMGGRLEFVMGREDSESLELYNKMTAASFTQTISPARIAVVPDGVTAIFGNCFLHRSPSDVYDKGQIAVASDTINPEKPFYNRYVRDLENKLKLAGS